MRVHCWRIVILRPCVYVRINSIEYFKTSAFKTHSSHFTVKQLLPLSFQTCVSTLKRQLLFIEAGFILHCNSFVILTFNLYLHSSAFFQHPIYKLMFELINLYHYTKVIHYFIFCLHLWINKIYVNSYIIVD